MPVFLYKANDANGKEIVDTITSVSRKTAINELFSRGLSPLDVKEKTVGETKLERQHSTRVSGKDVESFTRELGNLLGAGMSLSKALRILSKESVKPGVKKLWTHINDNVSNGMSLADAMRQWPKVFSPIYIAMVQAGETGGFLELVLGQIADFRSRDRDLKGTVQAALVYPLILVVLAIFILLFLMTYFIPKFSSIFADFGGSLPKLTLVVVSMSQFLMSYWIFIAGGIVLVVLGIKNFLSREEGREAFERKILDIPIFGELSANFAFVRFSRMLGTLIESGVPLITALNVAKEAIGNLILSRAVGEAVDKVRKGGTLSESLKNCPKLFSGTKLEMISIAEESARLGEELIRLAKYNEQELDRNLKTAVSFAEPIMLFAMAGIVGTIVVAMLLPIFNLQELIN